MLSHGLGDKRRHYSRVGHTAYFTNRMCLTYLSLDERDSPCDAIMQASCYPHKMIKNVMEANLINYGLET